MKGPVAKKEDLGTVLLQAKRAAKAIRAQRDRLLQFQLQPNLPSSGTGDAPARLSTEELGSGIVGAASLIEIGAKSLGVCLDVAARNGVRPSLPHALAALEEDKLFDRVLALRLPRRPVTQAHAFARVEAAVYAIYAVVLNIRRCIEHLSNIADPAPTAAATDKHQQVATAARSPEDIGKIGLPDTVAAATEHLAKIGLSDTDDAATGDPLPQETSGSMDLDKARTYLDRACTLASLAVKHVDLAVTAISSCLDPKEVARISDCADTIAIV